MPGKKQRVAVVRIPRQILTQVNSNERQDEAEPDQTTTQLKPQPLPEPEPPTVQVKPRLSEPDPVTIQVKPRPPPQPLAEPDSVTVQVKPRPLPQPLPEPDSVTVQVIPRPRRESVKTKKEHKDTHHTKADVFTLDVPQTSDGKIDDLNHQPARLPRPSPIIQQPAQINTWIKSSSNHHARPELNWIPKNQWSHDLWAFTEDCNMCCYACTCWCCFRHEISSMMGEHWCLWFINFAPLTHLRTKFRQQYAIEGSIAEDCCVGTFCPLCVALQLANEGRAHGHRIFS